MINEVLKIQKTKKYIIFFIIIFIFFISIYTLLDSFNISYKEMIQDYGVYLVVINIILNIIMAFLSAISLNLSAANVSIMGKDLKGSNLSFISVIFGLLTYGCTSCVIGFFSTIGIAFSVSILPFAGLPYKLISLVLLLIGLYLVIRGIKNSTCKIKNASE